MTNVQEWFEFDALEFERLFYRNTRLRKAFKEWSDGRKASSNSDLFYREIAAPVMGSLTNEVIHTYFEMRSYEKPLHHSDLTDVKKQEGLFNFLSPAYLLKKHSTLGDSCENSSPVCYAQAKELREGFED